MTFLAIFTTIALLLLTGVAAHNLSHFPRLRRATPDRNGEAGTWQKPGGVSILIPARNEATRIGPTVAALLAQAYPTFEVLVLDDDSADGTGEIARQAAQGDPRFCILRGEPLPAGWVGKNWACHQLAQAATYELLLFTDADVCWQPGALAAAVAQLQTSDADLLTLWPTQTTVTWSERLVVPLMALAVLAYLPVWLAHHSPYPAAAAANGQALLFRRGAYWNCGGHAGVRGEVVEDVRLAQRVKAARLRLRMADGNWLVQTRMYHCWPEVRDGYAKNILAGHWNSPALLIFSTLFHLLIFVGPWLWLAMGAAGYPIPGWPLWPLALVALGIGVRALTAWMTRQRLADAFWLPLSVLIMSWIAAQALWWRLRYGGPVWKGRRLGGLGEI
jgi:chlorobactene glucosyltransferase